MTEISRERQRRSVPQWSRQVLDYRNRVLA